MTGLIERLRALATRRETPCGAGTMVWHVWGESRPGLPPVVLFHGGSGSWTHWLRNIQPLVAAGRQVIAPDLPGFGESALPPVGGDADALVSPLAEGLLALLGGHVPRGDVGIVIQAGTDDAIARLQGDPHGPRERERE